MKYMYRAKVVLLLLAPVSLVKSTETGTHGNRLATQFVLLQKSLKQVPATVMATLNSQRPSRRYPLSYWYVLPLGCAGLVTSFFSFAAHKEMPTRAWGINRFEMPKVDFKDSHGLLNRFLKKRETKIIIVGIAWAFSCWVVWRALNKKIVAEQERLKSSVSIAIDAALNPQLEQLEQYAQELQEWQQKQTHFTAAVIKEQSKDIKQCRLEIERMLATYAALGADFQAIDTRLANACSRLAELERVNQGYEPGGDSRAGSRAPSPLDETSLAHSVDSFEGLPPETGRRRSFQRKSYALQCKQRNNSILPKEEEDQKRCSAISITSQQDGRLTHSEISSDGEAEAGLRQHVRGIFGPGLALLSTEGFVEAASPADRVLPPQPPSLSLGKKERRPSVASLTPVEEVHELTLSRDQIDAGVLVPHHLGSASDNLSSSALVGSSAASSSSMSLTLSGQEPSGDL